MYKEKKIKMNQKNIKKFYSQHYEDEYIINKFFKNKQNGVFVELGAIDGIEFSNTYWLEQHMNWTGVLIEPTKAEYDKLIINRPNSRCYNNAISLKKSSIKMENYGHGAMNRMDGYFHETLEPKSSFIVETLPIKDILHDAKIKNIDFMSIDVEGAELEVLETMDWDIPVYIILLEIKDNNNTANKSKIKNKKCREFLKNKNFEFVSSTRCDEIWINNNYSNAITIK